MTDYELVTAAERLTYKSDIKQSLPPNYTLLDLAEATQAVDLIAIAFFKKYGDRLQSLAPTLHRELEGWGDQIYTNNKLKHD